MRITEHGGCRVAVDLETRFTWEDAQEALSFMDGLGYLATVKLLVQAERSQSLLNEAQALEFGKSMGRMVSQGTGRIAVVHAQEARPGDMAFLLIDTSISLRHRMIAQFNREDEAKAWLNW